jgi:hypothetical protein
MAKKSAKKTTQGEIENALLAAVIALYHEFRKRHPNESIYTH